MRIKVDKFQGMVPQSASRRLGDYSAELVQNARLSLHELGPLKAPLPVFASTITGTLTSFYPLGNNWLVWNTDVDVVKSPIANDSHDRYFYTGDGVPRETNPTLAIGAGTIYPSQSYRLGLPAPEAKLTATPDASGTGTSVERVYVHSFKTQWGEEGPPSAPSTAATGLIDDVWNLSALEAAPANTVAISNITVASSIATVTHSANLHCANNEKWTFSGIRSVEDGESVVVATGGDLSTGISTIANGKVGTIAFAFNRSTFGAQSVIIQNTNIGSGTFQVLFNGANILVIIGKNGSGVTKLQLISTTAYTATGWHYVAASWDLVAGVGHLYIDQVDEQNVGGTVLTNDTLAYSQATPWVLFDSAGSDSYVGYLSGFYGNFLAYRDLSVAATLQKYTRSSPVNLLVHQGATGNFATGAQPEIYLYGGWSEFASNKGSAAVVTPSATNVSDGGATVPKIGSLTNALNGNSFAVTRVSATVFTVPLAAFTYITGGISTRDAPINVSSMTRKIYRTTVGGTYQFVAEQAASITTYADTVLDTALGELLPTNDLIAPPMDMIGLKSLPNGYLVGFSGNEVCFSEINKLHAFPAEYRLSVDFDIVGLGIWGSQVVVLTTGSHYLAIGSSPANTSLDTLDYNQAAVAKRGIVGLEYGVTFPTPNGVGFKGGGEVRNITEQLAEKPNWDPYNPSSMVGAIFDDKYILFYSGGGESGTESGSIILDFLEVGAEWVKCTVIADGVHYDRANGILYIAADNIIYEFDAHDVQLQTYFLSKIFQTMQKVCMTVGKVRWTPNTDATAESIASAFASGLAAITNALLPNGEPIYNGSFAAFTSGMYPVTGNDYSNLAGTLEQSPASLTFKFFADGVLVHTESVVDDGMFRISDEYGRVDEFQFSVTCQQGDVHEVLIGEMPSDLAQA